ncbi:16S rRNA (uracil1498-N3)-methyltransferase [Gracilibacillus halotolerans]|uniref:Ribosomal RNA small subunit methyltransferase E n=1 Tax=Gracilibacillus halotolerans TaxID=74386 RepID=A0A841RJL0_9BACI|nr:16S rRNA (uracil(1498)-N(3))-methyltransferase [Gracilibacillus halotolerans]MBB6511833.1 16S rRNA (uracil1498-N3)-methyltransferase [Gracilibacillus halotolerans]
MQRYFVPYENWNGDTVSIKQDDYHHIVRVMRMKIGNQVVVVHPKDGAAITTIVDINDNSVTCRIDSWPDYDTELPVDVTIGQGVPKGEKWEWILQKGTELGAKQFISFQAERSVVKWDERKLVKKTSRWEKIVKEASEQSHRNFIPSVQWMNRWEEFLEYSKTFDIRLFAYEEEAKHLSSVSLHSVYQTINPGAKILICIGPEGGFSEKEARDLRSHEFQSIRLGPRILRTETAPLYALASLSYYFEEMR